MRLPLYGIITKSVAAKATATISALAPAGVGSGGGLGSASDNAVRSTARRSDPYLSNAPRALAKYRLLAQEKFERNSAVNANFKILDAARQHLDRRRGELDSYRRSGMYQGKKLAPLEAEVEAAKAEVDRLIEAHAPTANRYQELAAIVANIDRALEQLPRGVATDADAVSINLKNVADGLQLVEKCRDELQAIDKRIANVKAAPRPAAEVKLAFRKEFEAIISRGAPDVFRALEFGESIGFPKKEMNISPGGHQIYFNIPDAMAFIAWLDPERVLKRIDEEIDARADDANALSSDERTRQLRKLAAERLRVERQEEATIAMAEAMGFAIPRRPDCDFRAILGLADNVPGQAKD
jgi:hypothetical protein